MKVFGLGLPELVIILVMVLVIFGPKNLPKLGAMLGRTAKKIRGRADEEFEGAEEEDSKHKAKAKRKSAAGAETEETSAEPKQLPSAKPKKKIVRRVVRRPAAEAELAPAESPGEAGDPRAERS